jgi:hypothetical protein
MFVVEVARMYLKNRILHLSRTDINLSKLKLHSSRLWASLYFFFNSAGIKSGLLYTNLLTPFLYIWLIKKRQGPVLWPLLLFLLPFDLIHIWNGIEWKSFVVSNLLFISTYIFVQCARLFVLEQHIGEVFKHILTWNMVFVFCAVLLFFTPYKEVLWYKNKFTQDVDQFYRLALLTFEASYYALLFAPIALYYLLKLLLGQNQTSAFSILFMIGVPLLLSLSVGVIAAIAISLICFYVFNWQLLLTKKSTFSITLFALLSLSFVLLLLIIFYPDNALFIRIQNIFSGVDSSTRGRTTDSFGIAWKVANERSIWFGSGLGQVKVLAHDIVKRYYNYWGDLDVVRIPNAVAETLAIFGIWGLVLRFGLIFYLFFKTRVLANHYQTAVFIFIFVYQFTGSYITNVVEYMAWILAFSTCFPQFDVVRLRDKF